MNDKGIKYRVFLLLESSSKKNTAEKFGSATSLCFVASLSLNLWLIEMMSVQEGRMIQVI